MSASSKSKKSSSTPAELLQGFRESTFFTSPSSAFDRCVDTILGRPVDFLKLHRYVEKQGGFNAMDHLPLGWISAASNMKFGARGPLQVKQAAAQLRDCSFRWNAYLGHRKRVREQEREELARKNPEAPDTESEDEAEADDEDDVPAQINISNVQEAIAKTVSATLEELQSICPSVNAAPKPVQHVMQELEKEVPNLSMPPPVRVGLLGGTGIGKTTTQNEILRITEVARPFYAQEEALEALNVSKERLNTVVEASTRNVLNVVDGAIPNTTILVSPSEETDRVWESELEEEKNSLDAVSALHDPVKRKNLCTTLFKLPPDYPDSQRQVHKLIRPYLLQVAHPTFVEPTTAHLIEIVYGSRFHFEIEYESKSDLLRYLMRHKFKQWKEEEGLDDVENEDEASNQDTKLLYQRFRECCVAEAPSSSSKKKMKDIKPTEKDLASMTDEEIEEHIPLNPDIKRVLDKTLVFTSAGKDPLHDRIYLRRLLFTVQRFGLRALQEQTSVGFKFLELWSKKLSKSADTHVIKRIRVFVPSILLQQNICLVDMPGSGDTNPHRYENMTQALDTCDAIICMTASDSIEADLPLADVLESIVGPRFFANNGKNPPELALFNLSEKNRKLEPLELHEHEPEPDRKIDMVVEYIASTKNVRRARTNGLTTEQIEEIKGQIQGMLSFRSLYPMHYSSLVQNSGRARRIEVYRKDLERTNMGLLFQFLLRVCTKDVLDELNRLQQLAENSLTAIQKITSATTTKLDATRFQDAYSIVNTAYSDPRRGIHHALENNSMQDLVQSRLGDVLQGLKLSLETENKQLLEQMKKRKLKTLRTAMLSGMKATYAHKAVPAYKRLTAIHSLHLPTVEILGRLEELSIEQVGTVIGTWVKQQINDGTIADAWQELVSSSRFREAIKSELRQNLGLTGQPSDKAVESMISNIAQGALKEAFDQVFSVLAQNEDINHPARFIDVYTSSFQLFQDLAGQILVASLTSKYSQALTRVVPTNLHSGQIMSPLKRVIYGFFHPVGRYSGRRHGMVKEALEKLGRNLGSLKQDRQANSATSNALESRIMNNLALQRALAEFAPRPPNEPFERIQPSDMLHLFDNRKNASKLHDVVRSAPSSRLPIHRAVANAMYDESNLQYTCFKHWRKGVLCRYLNNPTSFEEDFAGQDISDFLEKAGQKHKDDASFKKSVDDSMCDGSMQVPLLQGASDVLGCIFDVEVVGEDASIFRIAPQLTPVDAINVYRLVFDKKSGLWSAQQPQKQQQQSSKKKKPTPSKQ